MTAEKKAESLLIGLEYEAPPIPVEAIAKQLGLRVIFRSLEEDVSGMFYRAADRPYALINSDHHPVRQRFSIAHEIGHFILHASDEVFVDTVLRRDSRASLGVDKKEIEANRFAAELLMPRELIFRAVRRMRTRGLVSDDDDLINNLASDFDVSTQAMQYRLANLGLIGTF